MGAGRPPKPTALKILGGNPGKRPLNSLEPRPRSSAKVPRPPSFLSKEAKKEWRRVAPGLHEMGLLTEVDVAALAAYCQAFARWQVAEQMLTDEGMTFVTEKGYVGQHPAVAIARQSWQVIKQFAAEFGMTPSARGRMTLPEPKEIDPFEEYLSGSG
jgi:P27 family predicted phage terminase small subunit